MKDMMTGIKLFGLRVGRGYLVRVEIEKRHFSSHTLEDKTEASIFLLSKRESTNLKV